MKINQRQITILKALEKEVYISVDTLAKRLFASPSSIRRDLAELQSRNMVHRTHGGVTLFNPTERVASFSRRMTKNVQGKQIVAKKASAFLKDGMSVFLDGSTTVKYLLPYIAMHEKITLFTNNLDTATSAINEGIETHCTGGKAFNNSPVLIGPDTERFIKNLRVDAFFFSAQFLNHKGVISDSTQEETYIRSIILENCDKKYFLCDNDKVNQTALYTLTNVKDLDACILEKEWNLLECDGNIIY
ncbi:MAG: DeoR/GlpR transcriptional regulator [Clostridia bacterium]|nr:DeoR/GlpR transcriptional regulator [Clostridia bacterium]